MQGIQKQRKYNFRAVPSPLCFCVHIPTPLLFWCRYPLVCGYFVALLSGIFVDIGPFNKHFSKSKSNLDERGPLEGKVLLPDDGDGRAQLLLDRRRRLEHQVHDRKLDLLAVVRVDQVLALSGLEMKETKKNKVLNLKMIF